MIETYERLEKIVAPHLESYKEDLTKHDKTQLEKSDRPFIYGWRRTGTNMLFLVPKLTDWFGEAMTYRAPFGGHTESVTPESGRKILLDELIWITYSNTRFLYYDGHRIIETTKDHVTAIWTKYVNNLK